MEKSNQQTVTYNCRDGFKLDIVINDPSEKKNSIGIDNPKYEAYIYHDTNGIKSMTYGMDCDTLDDFISVIEPLIDEDIEAYQYMFMN